MLANCLRMMKGQTLAPAHIEIVNDAPLSAEKDITWRYRTGYDRLRGQGYDVIALIENDDWYAPHYLEAMVREWVAAGKPDIFGTQYTIYYHIGLRAWFTMKHKRRASAMNTLIKPDLSFTWCQDNDPYTDLHLWKELEGSGWHPEPPISIGIKHFEGLHGGRNHVDKHDRFINADPEVDQLYAWMKNDLPGFWFYSEYYCEDVWVC
jgi:hypothetical protein